MTLASAAAIRTRLTTDGYDVSAVELLSETRGGTERVYRVETAEGVRFVVTVGPKRVENVRGFFPYEGEVGLPATDLLEGEPPLLVMEAARGRPLSQLLPVYMLPGVWRTKHRELETGFERLGRYLGRIHSQSARGRDPITDISGYADRFTVPDDVADRLDGITETLGRVFETAARTEVTASMVHSDPTPHNIFYRDGDVELIDVDLRTYPSLKDRMVVECGLELMGGRLPYARASQATRLVASFRAGYERTGVDLDLPETFRRATKAEHYTWMLGKYLRSDRDGLRNWITLRTDPPLIEKRIERNLPRTEVEANETV